MPRSEWCQVCPLAAVRREWIRSGGNRRRVARAEARRRGVRQADHRHTDEAERPGESCTWRRSRVPTVRAGE